MMSVAAQLKGIETDHHEPYFKKKINLQDQKAKWKTDFSMEDRERS